MEPTNLHASAAGLRRENESTDDFEHLEAESTSPVKEISGEKNASKEQKSDNGKCDNESFSLHHESSPLVKALGESQRSSYFPLLSHSNGDSSRSENLSTFGVEDIAHETLEFSQRERNDGRADPFLQSVVDSVDFKTEPKSSSEVFLTSFGSSASNVTTALPSSVDDFLNFESNSVEDICTKSDDVASARFESIVKDNELNLSHDIPELSASEGKFMDFHPEDKKRSIESGMGDVLRVHPEFIESNKSIEVLPEGVVLSKPKADREEEEEEFNLAASQDSSPIHMADKLEQYNSKAPYDALAKNDISIEDTEESLVADNETALIGLIPSCDTVNDESLPLAKSDPVPPEVQPASCINPVILPVLDSWFKPEKLHPKVENLVYWRNPGVSGAVLGVGLALLLSLSYCSLISVIAYVSLTVLIGSSGFRLYRAVLAAVNKTGEGHPFRDLLDKDITVSPDRAASLIQQIIPHINGHVAELRRLFLVEDILDSIKFGVLLWALTYVGAIFNGLTLVILAFVSAFTLPRLYENNKQQIDKNMDIVRAKIAEITAKVQGFNPLSAAAAAKKTSSEDKKEN